MILNQAMWNCFLNIAHEKSNNWKIWCEFKEVPNREIFRVENANFSIVDDSLVEDRVNIILDHKNKLNSFDGIVILWLIVDQAENCQSMFLWGELRKCANLAEIENLWKYLKSF